MGLTAGVASNGIAYTNAIWWSVTPSVAGGPYFDGGSNKAIYHAGSTVSLSPGAVPGVYLVRAAPNGIAALSGVATVVVTSVDIEFTNTYANLSLGDGTGVYDGIKWAVATFSEPDQTNVYWGVQLKGMNNAEVSIKYQRGAFTEASVGWIGDPGALRFTDGWLNASVRMVDGSNSAPQMVLISNTLTVSSVQQGDRIIVEEPCSGARDTLAVVKNFTWNDLQRLGTGNLQLHSAFNGLSNAVKDALTSTIVFCLDPTVARAQKSQLTNDCFPDSGLSCSNYLNFHAAYTNLLKLDIPSARSIGNFPDDIEHCHMGLEVAEDSLPSAITNLQRLFFAALAVEGSFQQTQSNTTAMLVDILNCAYSDTNACFMLFHSYEDAEGRTPSYVDPAHEQTLENGDPIRNIRWQFGTNAAPRLSFPGVVGDASAWDRGSAAPENVRQIPLFIDHAGRIVLCGESNVGSLLYEGIIEDAVRRN